MKTFVNQTIRVQFMTRFGNMFFLGKRFLFANFISCEWRFRSRLVIIARSVFCRQNKTKREMHYLFVKNCECAILLFVITLDKCLQYKL